MTNWDILKSAIAGIIKTNGNQEITGQLLQNVLNNIVTSVGENATFAGIATTRTNPGTPDGPVFYLATEAGIYLNFGGISVAEGEAVILSNKTGAWEKNTSGFATQQSITELAKNAFKNYFIGGGSGYVRNEIYGLIPGHAYTITLKSTEWDLPSVAASDLLKFGVHGWKDGVEQSILAFGYGHVLSKQYTFIMPDVDYIAIGGRATVGTKVWYNLDDTTDTKTIFESIGVSAIRGINIDTVNKIIDFGSDAVLIIGNNTYILQNIHSDVTKYRNIPYYVTNSGANIIVFNLDTKEIYAKVYYHTRNKNEVLIGTVCSVYQTHEFQIANFPFSYTVDGKKPWRKDVDNVQNNLDKLAKTQSNDWDAIVKGINHRGWHEAPENTLVAFKQSKLNGFNYVECDISFTSDNVPVLLHDATIDRTSNGEGAINSLTYQQVLQYDFGSWKGEAYAGTKISTLAEFLTLCRNIGLHPYLEIKNLNSIDNVNEIVSIVNASGMRGKVTYISFGPSILSRVKELDDSARLGIIVDYLTESTISTVKTLQTGKNEVFVDASSTNTDFSLCIAESIPIEHWTFNSKSSIINASSYVSGFTSDLLVAGKVLYENSIQ